MVAPCRGEERFVPPLSLRAPPMFSRAPQPRIYIQKVYSVVNAVYAVVVLNVRIEVALDEVY